MTALDDLIGMKESPARDTLDPTIYVEPRDKVVASEYQRQRALIGFIRKHAPRVTVFAIPNATQSEYSKLKQQREGAVYGATDLVFTWTGGVAFVEMKDGIGRPQPNQIDFLNRLARQNHNVAICRTMEGAVRWLRSVGAPVPAL